MVNIVGWDSTAIKRATCKSCSAILEYTQSEVKRRSGHDYVGDPWVEEYIDCPKCNNRVVVKSW